MTDKETLKQILSKKTLFSSHHVVETDDNRLAVMTEADDERHEVYFEFDDEGNFLCITAYNVFSDDC